MEHSPTAEILRLYFLGTIVQKSPTAKILSKYFLRTIDPRKYKRKISAVELFCCDKFEETPKQKVIDLSKFEKLYFSSYPVLTYLLCYICFNTTKYDSAICYDDTKKYEVILDFFVVVVTKCH